MVESCPHSIYFFRSNVEHFEFINDFKGNKTAEELTVHPNPLLIASNEGDYYRAIEPFKTTTDYVEGPGIDVEIGDYVIVKRVTSYNAVTPASGANPSANGWFERFGTAGAYTYVKTTDTTVVSGKTYYEEIVTYKFDDFGDSVTNTFRDWHILPLGRPTISPPQQKTNLIDIPGTDGVMDVSNSLTKYPVFATRTGSMKFAVDYDKTDWLTAYTKAMRVLQGVNVKMILEDDPLYFYEGRVFVEEFDSRNDGTWSELTLGYELQPYRRSIYASTDNDWLWDPFNFETDVIKSSVFSSIEVTDAANANWNNCKVYDFSGLVDRMPVTPEFIVDTFNNSDMTAQLYNTDIYGSTWKTFTLPEGQYSLHDLIFCEQTRESKVKMRFRNPGNVTIKFRSGRL